MSENDNVRQAYSGLFCDAEGHLTPNAEIFLADLAAFTGVYRNDVANDHGSLARHQGGVDTFNFVAARIVADPVNWLRRLKQVETYING